MSSQESQAYPVPHLATKSYLIIAYFNYEKWKALTDAEHERAERVAEALFPEERLPLPNQPDYEPLPQLQGVREVCSFASDVFGRLPADFYMQTRAQKIAILDPIYASQRPKPPTGWMAVVDANDAASFIARMGGDKGGFWRMFDIEIRTLKDGWTTDDVYRHVPALNDDQTTHDVYLSMTIRNWN
jgi:hypothetical protein